MGQLQRCKRNTCTCIRRIWVKTQRLRRLAGPSRPDIRGARVFATITDFARFPEWRSEVRTVELLGDDGRGMRFREDGKHGVVTYRVERRQPDSRLVTRIDDPSLPYGGTWTLEVKPAPEGAALTITEDGEIYNPIFRVLSKVIFSPYATIDIYQSDLRKRLTS
ncbi:MAG TPA: SRPBCC family protein [Vicinamibacterales bacterium]|nr:SRPBCC family protein [Vicinamibacterales bacterium]